MVLKLIKFFVSFWAIILFLTLIAPLSSLAADIGNCLLCHKYPGLSRIDENGKFRLMYVNEDIFNKSVHAKVKCEGCHPDIQKIPHEPAKKVDCLTQCHIIEPSKVDKKGNLKKYPDDIPTCKNCHDNPLYRPLSFFKRVRPGISDVAIGRCRVCHKSDEFIYRFYNHITTRLHKIRNPRNIAEVCARCHDDDEIVARHNNLSTKAVFSYGETFHGKAARFLDERIPDCLDCHVKPGESVHQMLRHDDPNSITHINNRGRICATTDCHPKATPQMANYKVHAEFNKTESPLQYYFQVFFIVLTGGTLLPLMGLLFLDLFRRLFPNAVIKRSKSTNGKTS